MAWQSATKRYEGFNKKKIQALSDTNQISISFITSVQIQHSLCTKVTLNNSGSSSIIQCLLLYGLTWYKCSCVSLLGARKTREGTHSGVPKHRSVLGVSVRKY